jgi:hypothetical protein
MYHARDRAGRRPWRSILLGAVSLTALLLSLAFSQSAAGDCPDGGGSGCMPTGGGYTIDEIWNCGAIGSPTKCYFDATTNVALAGQATWGWGSATYTGTGTTWVCVRGGASFFGCGTNLARSCALRDCTDQDLVSMAIWVENTTGTHTVHGHGQA